jgi:hypothetical protein
MAVNGHTITSHITYYRSAIASGLDFDPNYLGGGRQICVRHVDVLYYICVDLSQTPYR